MSTKVEFPPSLSWPKNRVTCGSVRKGVCERIHGQDECPRRLFLRIMAYCIWWDTANEVTSNAILLALRSLLLRLQHMLVALYSGV
ncbi:hypothetical protein K469DRAFT_712495 [Zopfia rhizophila CBS 207.26]|uniref:Uncharacterized protein n=1 Tax=Zopfia rhizophila CBS 207.26 TaxID=1314779 RepID=A0A6A6ERU6_9PEZI|nr:hypothetical protein K469DRAFT_712495 [Zopfia rhizophila CBS 207.26]